MTFAERAGAIARDGRPTAVLALSVALGVIAVAVARLVLFGWAEVAPDDARYVYVGLSTLDGHGPLTPSGTVFLLRSPAYGIMLAVGRSVVAADPVAGARIVAAGLAVAGLAAAVSLSWSLGGAFAALGTALTLLSTTLLWRLLPTLRIDLPQAAGMVAVLLALRRPTARRWALAGALFGLTVLVKETIGLMALAPLALGGTMPRDRLARLWGLFILAAILVAGWWWVVVWADSGALFPLNAIGVIERRAVGADLRMDTFGLGLLAVIAAGWLVVGAAARRDRGLRLLVAAAACLAPPAAYAMLNGLSTRNLTGLAVLSAVAVGVAGARIARLAAARGGGLTGARLTGARLTGAGAMVLIAAIGLAGALAGQARVGDPSERALPGQLVAWLRSESPAPNRVVMTFRDSEIVALRLYGEIAVPTLAPTRVERTAALSEFIWVGLRDRQLFGYTRSGWMQALSQPGTSDLVLSGPHPLTPAELIPTGDAGGLPGLAKVRSFEADGDLATIYRVDPGAVRAGESDIAVHLSPDAALAWLELTTRAGAGGDAGAGIGDLVASRAIVVGPDTGPLIRRLDGLACLVRLGEPGSGIARIDPAGPACDGAAGGLPSVARSAGTDIR